MEQLLIKKINGGFVGLKNGTKEPLEVWKFIKKLREVNEHLADDYEMKYKEIVKELQEKK